MNNAVNRLWGEVNGVGQNMLGIMLMELRAEFSVSAKINAQQKKEANGNTSSLNGMRVRRRADCYPTVMR